MLPALEKALIKSLGFPEPDSTNISAPYINYIKNRHDNSGTIDEYLLLFTRIVQDFSDVRTTSPVTIRSYVDSLCNSQEPFFQDVKEGQLRRELVTDTVLYILGIWTTACSYFVKAGARRQIQLAYCIRQGKSTDNECDAALDATLPKLLRGSGLIPASEGPGRSAISTTVPTPALDSRADNANIHLLQDTHSDFLEAACIKSTHLNAYTLFSLANTRISWTLNFSRHLLLTPHAGHHTLELFALPCALKGGSLLRIAIPATLINEIHASYSVLFNSYGTRMSHVRHGKPVGLHLWCWCRCCCLRRLRDRELDILRGKTRPRKRFGRKANDEFDTFLVDLMIHTEPEDWSHDLFPHLWPRIVALEEHLNSAKPWNFWVLFADRRDTLQFWTFLFGTVILFLTLLQVGLGIAQVIGSF